MSLFTDELRKTSRQVHDVSDALVNARLLALFTSKSLYARAIGCFYLVFEELELQLKICAEDKGKHGRGNPTCRDVTSCKQDQDSWSKKERCRNAISHRVYMLL